MMHGQIYIKVMSDYPKNRENRNFSEELSAPKLPNEQYVQINWLGHSKKYYVVFWVKNYMKTATKSYQCLETSQ